MKGTHTAAWLSSAPGVLGTLKERYEDFVVREVGETGVICGEPDGADPDEEETRKFLMALDAPPTKRGPETARVETALGDVLQGDELARLRRWLDDTADASEFTLAPVADKTRRTAVHMALKGLGLASRTVTKDETPGQENSIVVSKARKGARSAFDPNKRPWPKGRQDFTHFTLKKCNLETNKALWLLSTNLPVYCRTPVKFFSTAGLKDKRGVTYQRVSAKRCHPSALLDACRRVNAQGAVEQMRVGDFAFAGEPIRVGGLRGNRFELRVTKILYEDGPHDETNAVVVRLRERCEHVMERPVFPNYFGPQRFGTTHDIPTHAIGLLIAQGKYEEAVRTIAATEKEDCSGLVDKILDGGVTVGELKKHRLSPQCFSCLSCMLKNAREYAEARPDAKERARHNVCRRAIQGIPGPKRSLYIHALQSFVFNAMVEDIVRGLSADDVMSHVSMRLPFVTSMTPLTPAQLDRLDGDAREAAVALASLTGEFAPFGADRAVLGVAHDFTYKIDAQDAECVLETSFSLDSGAYATVFIRELLGAEPRTRNDK